MDTLHHILCLPAVPQVGAEHTLGTYLPRAFTGLLFPLKCLSQAKLSLGSLWDPTWACSLQNGVGLAGHGGRMCKALARQ